MVQKAGEVIEIDTKEICLLCYDPCVTSDGEEVMSRTSSLTGLKQLLRYLKVNTKQLFNCSPGFLQWMEIKHEIDVRITLCANCLLVTEKFDKLHKEYELIQFQFDKCLTSLHRSMKSGANDPERVREFKKRMQPNKSFDLINASIAANLRDQTFKKCSLKLGNLIPRVTLHKIKHDDAHHDDNHFNQKPVDLNISDNKSEAASASAAVQTLLITNNETNQVIQDWLSSSQNPYDQTIEVPEVDPLEPDDNFLEDEGANDDETPPINFLPSNSSASAMTFASSSHPIPISNKRPSSLEEGSNICDICSKTFGFRADVRRHQYLVHPEHIIFKHYSSKLPVSLDECKDLATKFLKRASANSVKKGKAIICCYCDKTLTRISGFKAHLMNQHLEIVADIGHNHNPVITAKKVRNVGEEKCDECSKVFNSKAQLNKHKATHSTFYSCQYCSYTSAYLGNVKLHELREHIVDLVTPHMAPIICPVKFSQGVNAYYKKLLRIGTRCPICGGQMPDKHFLQRHIPQQHFDDFLKRLKDYLDQGEFRDNDENESEERDENSSSEQFSCQFCPFTSNLSEAARLHELETHTVDLVLQHLPHDTSRIKCAQGVVAYQNNLVTMGTRCPICVSTFRTNAHLQRHILTNHFEELVRELKDYLEGCRGGEGGSGVDMEEPCLMNVVPPPVDIQLMEFEMDNVKLEVGTKAVADNAALFDPSNVDYLD